MRFVVAQRGRYWIVTDTETGASWPYLNDVAAQQKADDANNDATTMRDQFAAATESPLPTPDPPTVLQEAP